MTKNWNCDNDKCRDAHGEVRKLPSGGDANMILCHDCFDYEIVWRRYRNKELGKDAQFKLPRWDDLEVYDAS